MKSLQHRVMSKHLVQNLIKKLVCKSDVCDEI